MDLPDYIDSNIFQNWIEMRKEKKYPITDRVQCTTLLILRRAIDEGHDPNSMLLNATQGEWQGLFTGDNTQRKPRRTRETGKPILTAVADHATAAAGIAAAKKAV